jgi:hypothetical protein
MVSRALVGTRFYSADSLSRNNEHSVNNISLEPFFITGLTDAEGTFVTIVKKNISSRLK